MFSPFSPHDWAHDGTYQWEKKGQAKLLKDSFINLAIPSFVGFW